MFVRYLDEKNNSNTFMEFVCDECKEVFTRIMKNQTKILLNPYYDKDYCNRCWRKVLNLRPEYRKNMAQAILKRNKNNPDIYVRQAATMRKVKANCGDKNGMKQPEARKKVSEARKKMFLDSLVRQHYSDKTRQAWADGKFKDAKVGKCSWYSYQHSSGIIYKVQGTWELAFIKWLDDMKLHFDCHRGRIPYVLNGKKKNYYPDFKVFEWDAIVDVKCLYFYSEVKFAAIRECNPELEIQVLFKNDLLKLGVKI